MQDTNCKQIVVVGCGVIGLTTALTLQKSGRYSVTIVAENTPDDINDSHGPSQQWASPFAGAYWVSIPDKNNDYLRASEEYTYFCMRDLAKEIPDCGVRITQICDFHEYSDRDLGYMSYVRGLYEIDRKLWPEGVTSGYSYESFVVNVPIYLTWLVTQFTKCGGKIKHARINHISEALKHCDKKCDVIVNCSGLGSGQLGGVRDGSVYPIRGQTLLVNAPHVRSIIVAPGNDPVKPVYIIPRGDGTVIIGGVYEENQYNKEEDSKTTDDILRKCLAICPQLINKGTSLQTVSNFSPTSSEIECLRQSIIRVNIGFRPGRSKGTRVELEDADGFTILHNYGHANYGYITSWGFASESLRILNSSQFK